MAIDSAGIMKKLQEYADSTDGRKKISDTIQSYRNGSDAKVKATGKTHGGGSIVTEKQMATAAKELIALLRVAAANENLPASVMEHIESFDYTQPHLTSDGSYKIHIFMTDDPRRDSLQPQKFDGVDNIVAIINNGYTADGQVFGRWHGKKTASLTKRQGSFFMQKAIDAFNDKYGRLWDVSVWLNPLYDGAWSPTNSSGAD